MRSSISSAGKEPKPRGSSHRRFKLEREGKREERGERGRMKGRVAGRVAGRMGRRGRSE